MAEPDGFYAVYATGQQGNSIIMLVIQNEILVGADVGGMKYDGKIEKSDAGYRCSVVYVVPPNAALITGANPSGEPIRVPVEFTLPLNFSLGEVVLIETPLGRVNVKFEKIRDL